MIASNQPSAMGIHYLYHSLEDMLNCQRRAGYESMELWCAAPHVSFDPSGRGRAAPAQICHSRLRHDTSVSDPGKLYLSMAVCRKG